MTHQNFPSGLYRAVNGEQVSIIISGRPETREKNIFTDLLTNQLNRHIELNVRHISAH